MKKNSKQGAEAFGNGLAQQDPLCDLSTRKQPHGTDEIHHRPGGRFV